MEWNGPNLEGDESNGSNETRNMDETQGEDDMKERQKQAALHEERRKVVWESVFRVLSGRTTFYPHASPSARFLRSINDSDTSTPAGHGPTSGGLTVVRILEKNWCVWLRGRKEMSSKENGDGVGEWCRKLRRKGVRVEDMWGVAYGI